MLTFIPFFNAFLFSGFCWRSTKSGPAAQNSLHRMFGEDSHERRPVLPRTGAHRPKIPGGRETPGKIRKRQEKEELRYSLKEKYIGSLFYIYNV